MSDNSMPLSRAASELLERIGNNFQAETSALARADFAVQEALEQSVDTRFMLGQEALKLIDSMAWLKRHKFLGRFATGFQVEAVNQYEIKTSPMFASVSEEIIGPTSSERLSDFYTYTARLPYGFFRDDDALRWRTLEIVRTWHGEESGEEEPAEYWRVSTAKNAADDLVKIGFDSTRTDDYKEAEQAKIIAKYKEQNPWLVGCECNSSDSEKPEITQKFGGKTCSTADGMYSLFWGDSRAGTEDAISHGFVVSRLKEELTRGHGWDYRDNDYNFMWGLIRQAQSQLHQRQIRSKLLK